MRPKSRNGEPLFAVHRRLRQIDANTNLARNLSPPFSLRDINSAQPISGRLAGFWKGHEHVNLACDRLEHMAAIAASDEREATIMRWEFFKIVASAVKRLNHLVQKNPVLWRGIAEDEPQWPVMLSEHPADRKKAEALLRNLNVSLHVLPKRYRKAKWNAERDPFMQAASQLLEHVQRAAGLCGDDPIYPFCFIGWRRDAVDLRDVEFNSQTWREWWVIARAAFLEGYPHPEKVKELADIARQQLNKDTRRTPGRVKHRILYILQSRVQSIARGQCVIKVDRLK